MHMVAPRLTPGAMLLADPVPHDRMEPYRAYAEVAMNNQHQRNGMTAGSSSQSGIVQLERTHEVGNVGPESRPFRGWFVGRFVPERLGLRATDQVEVKWGEHAAGERQAEWSLNRAATTISLLLRGRDRISFPDGDALLEHEGDYVIWGPGIPHRWHALADSVVLTIRWPSAAGDAVVLSDDELAAWRDAQAE